jgi:hypothetical protein
MAMLYKTSMGYTEKRPANFPAFDRARLMKYAHQVARTARGTFRTYHEAFAYGLKFAHEHFHRARCDAAVNEQLRAARDRNIRQPTNRDRHVWGSVAAGI